MLLKEYFRELTLSEEHYDYLLSRGARPELVEEYMIRTFVADTRITDPSMTFLKNGGSICDNCLIFPYFSPRNEIVFYEIRDHKQKRLFKVGLPNSHYTSFFGGLNAKSMEKIWSGCDVWLVEGMFDLFALDHVISKDQVILASLRAGLSHEQLHFFQRFVTGRVRILYDNDQAGRGAIYGKYETGGVLSKLTEFGLKVDVPLYLGKDPGDIWMTQGIYGLKKHLNFGV